MCCGEGGGEAEESAHCHVSFGIVYSLLSFRMASIPILEGLNAVVPPFEARCGGEVIVSSLQTFPYCGYPMNGHQGLPPEPGRSFNPGCIACANEIKSREGNLF